jgi:hypothetical protein
VHKNLIKAVREAGNPFSHKIQGIPKNGFVKSKLLNKSYFFLRTTVLQMAALLDYLVPDPASTRVL